MKHGNKLIIPTLLGSLLILGGCSSSSSSDPAPTPANPAGTLQLSSATYAGPEGTANIVITVSRTGGTDGAVSVDYATSDGTATVADMDYTAIPATTLNWADGDGADKTFNVVVNTADTNPEFTEDLTVTLSNEVTASLGGVNTAVVSITDDDSVLITGTLTAPGASLVLLEPTFGDKLLAGVSDLFFGVADAAIGSVVPGTTVEVYEVDNNGAIVAGPITTATTDGAGTYTLAAPLDAPASKYIVRADDGAGNTLDSRISFTTTDVDPVSDATSFVIASNALDLTALTPEEVDIIQTEITNSVVDIDATGSASAISGALVTEAATNQETANIIASTVTTGSICGTVTKVMGATPMMNVLVVARDFGDWVTRAKVKTAADGTYCLNVPAGDYIVGAINRTGNTLDPEKSASEWYNAAGNGRGQFDGDAVTVAMAAVLGIDFDLVPGARISGTMTTFDAGSAEGVRVLIRDFETFVPIAAARVKADNTFRVSVPAGDYIIIARNRTFAAPYATQMFGAAAAYNNNRNAGSRETVVAGDIRDASMTLAQGYRLNGTVLDAPAGTPVQGVRVRINTTTASSPDIGGPAARVRTKGTGAYRIWLKPASYSVQSRGNASVVSDLSAMNQTVDFSTQRAIINGVVQDAGSNPVSQAKILLYDDPMGGSTYNLVSQELSNSDGSFTLYGAAGANYKVLFRIDDQQTYGSIVSPAATTINSGTNFMTNAMIGVVNNFGTIALPTVGSGSGLGWIAGTVAANGTTGIQGGQLVQIRTNMGDNTTRFYTTRTRGDGSYRLSAPAGSSYRVRIVITNYNNQAVVDNSTTTLNVP